MSTSTDKKITGVPDDDAGVSLYPPSSNNRIMPCNVIQNDTSVTAEAGVFTNFANTCTLVPFIVPKGFVVGSVTLWMTTGAAGDEFTGLLYEYDPTQGGIGDLIAVGGGKAMTAGAQADNLTTDYVGEGKLILGGFWADFATATAKVGKIDTGASGNGAGDIGAILPMMGSSATFLPGAGYQKPFSGTYASGTAPSDLSSPSALEEAGRIWLGP